MVLTTSHDLLLSDLFFLKIFCICFDIEINSECTFNHMIYFFPGPQAFCKQVVERVRSEKSILNSSVEWSGWSGFF